MNVFQSTKEFDDWLRGLKDRVAKARIFGRIDAATLGNFGECEAVGEGVSEMKIHVGPGYRIYYTRIGTVVYVLLAGGNKSTQKKDIKRALELARGLPKGE
ncbi:MAG: type II toxin-antitoxin system RelE/ParE family toxin [Burkholderiaceae bacterium]|nr:type II toxin-antitoxin system RelE/ParE family toxin [Burkholderiaceae bacterium]